MLKNKFSFILTLTMFLLGGGCWDNEEQNNNTNLTTQEGITTDVKKIDVWRTYKTSDNGLVSDRVTKLARDEAGGLWIGTDGGLNRFDFDGESWLSFTKENSNLKDNKISALRAVDDSLLVASGEPSVFQALKTTGEKQDFFDEKTLSYKIESFPKKGKDLGFFQRVPGRTGFWASIWGKDMQIVKCFLETNDIASWLGTSQGIHVQNGDGYEKTYVGTEWNDGKNHKVQALARDSKGSIWIGLATYNERGTKMGGGIVRYSKNQEPDTEKQDNWKLFTTEDGLSHNDVTAIAIDKRDHVWVATKSGLNRFIPGIDDNEGTWTSMNAEKLSAQGGFAVDDLTDLAYDSAKDILWIGSNGGGLTSVRLNLLD